MVKILMKIVQDNDILAGHDIALLELTEEVTLSDVVWPACLPGSSGKTVDILLFFHFQIPSLTSS